MKDYDYRNCQSLFGYAAKVHERPGAVCQLCSAGGPEVDFDFWRQLTVEHLIGEGQGGLPASDRRRTQGTIPVAGRRSNSGACSPDR